MVDNLLKIGGLALTVACWLWARDGQRSDTWNTVLIWCAPLFMYPITLWGRRALDARPVAARVVRLNVLVHYAMMIALGVGIFPAIRLVHNWPGITIPVPRQLGLALVILTGFAALLTVVNLAVRGWGAPFAAKLSSRLAVDWMYAWTRNPMVLATLAWLFCVGLWRQSAWFVLWVVLILSPGLIFFVCKYEERELRIRFGPTYDDYRAHTPRLWPRKPRPVARPPERLDEAQRSS